MLIVANRNFLSSKGKKAKMGQEYTYQEMKKGERKFKTLTGCHKLLLEHVCMYIHVIVFLNSS